MFHTNFRVLLPALVLPALLAGCSGGDDTSTSSASTPSDPGSSTGAPGEPSASPTQVGTLVKKCRADVKVTGEITGSWAGPGEVRVRNSSDTGDGPQATYVSADGKYQLMVYSSGPGFKKAATLAVDGSCSACSSTATRACATCRVAAHSWDSASLTAAQLHRWPTSPLRRA